MNSKEICNLNDIEYAEYITNKYYDNLKTIIEYDDLKSEILLQICKNKLNNTARSMHMKYIINKHIPKYYTNKLNTISINDNINNNINDNYTAEKLDNINNNISDIIKMKAKLHELTPRENKILELRYYCDLKLEEVGEEFMVTRERIRQVEAKALRKLRTKMKISKYCYK